MKRRAWRVILCLFLWMTLLPAAAFAEGPEPYDLTLSMQVTGNYVDSDKYFSLYAKAYRARNVGRVPCGAVNVVKADGG